MCGLIITRGEQDLRADGSVRLDVKLELQRKEAGMGKDPFGRDKST